ncbi:MAG: hypothetical protein ACRDWF_04835 [Acidimicrobiia bacterium]
MISLSAFAFFYATMAETGGVIGYLWDASRVGCRQVAVDLVDCYADSTTASLTWTAIGAITGSIVAGLAHPLVRLNRQAVSGG